MLNYLRVKSTQNKLEFQKQYFDSGQGCSGRNNGPFGKIGPVAAKTRVEWGCRYGEAKYEFSFGLAPRNGELSPSVPKTPEPFNSPFRVRHPERSSDSKARENLGLVFQNWEYRGIYTQR